MGRSSGIQSRADRRGPRASAGDTQAIQHRSLCCRLFCVECDISVELDRAPHFRKLRAEYEAERTAFLQGLGIELIRFENRTVHQNIQAVLETIREAIRNRTASDLPGRADQTNATLP